MSHHTKELYEWMGELAILHTSGSETDGKFYVLELYATREGSTSWHTHTREDESYYIIEGVITLYIGEEVHKLKAGDFAMAPKGVPHRYTVDSKGYARVLLIGSPAGAEGLIRESGKPVSQMKPSIPNKEDIDYGSIRTIAAKYGIRFNE